MNSSADKKDGLWVGSNSSHNHLFKPNNRSLWMKSIREAQMNSYTEVTEYSNLSPLKKEAIEAYKYSITFMG